MKNDVILSLLILFIFSIINLNAQRHFEYIEATGDLNLNRITEYVEGALIDKSTDSAKRELKFFNRWKKQVLGRLDKDGNLVNYAARNYSELRRFIKSQKKLDTQFPTTRNVHGSWENVTPGEQNSITPLNGRVSCVVVHPNDPNTIFIGTPVGGIWVSYNGGTSWINLNSGMDNLGVSSIVIDHIVPNTMYILTGEGDGRDCPSMGVFKSTNGGYDWNETSVFWEDSDIVYGYKMIMNPNNPNNMYAVTTKGIYQTTDGWNTFEQKQDTIEFRDIEFAPESPDTIYASTWFAVFKSTDSGANWNLLDTNGLPPISNNWNRVALGVAPSNSGIVYAIYARNFPAVLGGYHELYLSEDYGNSFTIKSAGTGKASSQSHYNLNLLVDPNDPETIYLGTVNLWKSEDRGIFFEKITNGEGLPDIHADIHALEWSNGTLYAATDGGISSSTNGGSSFSNISNGLTLMMFYDIDVEGSTLMGGTQDNGTHKWTIGDAETNFIFGGDGLECMFDPESSGEYLSTQNNRFRCFSGDECWKLITPAGQEDDVWQGSWIMHPTDNDTIYSAVKTFARSYDKGSTWDILNPGFTNQNIRIESTIQGIDNPHRLYISNRAELRRTTSLHSVIPTWIDIAGNLPLTDGVVIGEITVDPNNADRVWVSLLGYNSIAKVFYSETGGLGTNPWINITENLPNVPAYCIEYKPNSNDGIYLGTDFGVFFRDNTMTEWTWFSNSLPKTRVEDMKITDNFLYVGTYGRGLWRSAHFGTCPNNLTLTIANDPSPSYSTGTQVHSASGNITSTRILSGGFGTHVRYSAGGYIRLDPGFHAKKNNELTAVPDGCPD